MNDTLPAEKESHDFTFAAYQLMKEQRVRLEIELAAVTAECAKLSGIIYRSTCYRLNV